MSEFLSIQMREFPGGLVVRTQSFYHCGLGTIPSLRTEVPHQAAAYCCQKKKKKKKQKEQKVYDQHKNPTLSLFLFLGPHPQHTEAPRLGVKSELQPLAYATTQQLRMQAASALTYTTAHGNAGSVTH